MAVLQTYQVTTNREDLTDIVTNITPTKTPFLSSAPSNKAYMTYHEWSTDEITVPTANDNAQVEGVDFQSEDQYAPDRAGSFTQIFTKWPHVSDTQKAVRSAGVKDLYNYNVTNKLKQIALEVEIALVQGTGNSGASATAREIKGFLAAMTTNTASGAGASAATLTETMYNALLKTIWESGGDADTTFCTGTLKQTISGFTGGSTKNVDAKSKKLIASVDVYEGDFGLQKIIAHRLMPASTLAALERDKWAVCLASENQTYSLGQIGRFHKGYDRG